MKLTLAAGLGALITEHRPGIPEFLCTLAKQPVLHCCPHHRCGALRSQGAGAIATIMEAVHLLAHHIGAFTDATTKQIRALKQRRADLTKTGTQKMLPRHSLHRLPALQGLRQQINHAPETLQLIQNPGPSISGPVCTLTSA